MNGRGVAFAARCTAVGFAIWAQPVASVAQVCERADALLVAQRLEQAREAYANALADTAAWECGLEGLGRLAAAYVQLGEMFLRMEQRDSARNNFIRAMSQSPSSSAARDAEQHLRVMATEDARRTRQSTPDPFEVARALSELGMLAEARDSLARAVAREPSRLVPADLRYLSGGPLPPWRGLRRWAESWIRFSPTLLAVLALGAYLVAGARRKPRLSIDDFNSQAVKDASQIGGGFSGMVGAALMKLLEGERDQSIDVVRAEVGPTDVSANVQSLVPGGGAWVDGVLKLMRMIEPTRSLVLAGHVHDDTARGVGVTMQLRRGRRAVAGTTLWLADVWDEPKPLSTKDYSALAEAAAIWLAFHLPRTGKEPFRLLGTEDWLAYARLQTSLRQSSVTMLKRVALLQSALGRDPDFSAALANLAIQYLSSSFPDVDPRARALLEKASDFESTGALDTGNPTPFVALVYLVQIAQGQGHQKEAGEYASRLVRAIDRVESSRSSNEAFKAYLRRMRPTAEIMQAIYTDDAIGGVTDLDADHSRSGSWHTLYSLACAWSIVASRESDPARVEQRDDAEAKALDRLESAFALHEAAKAWAPRDQALEWIRDKASQSAQDRFRALAKPLAAPPPPPSPPPPPLAQLRSITLAYAEKLQSEGIGDWQDLLLCTVLGDRRQQLAKAVDAPLDLVECWAHLADLHRIVGMRTPEVNLLQLCGIGSVHRLAASTSAVQLTSALAVIASAQGVPAPTLDQVRAWIEDARGLMPKVA